MIPNPADATDYQCANGHFSRYFYAPAMCPIPGCCSREFKLADPRAAQRDRDEARRTAKESDTVRWAR